MSPLFDLCGKRVLVTGATGGLGAAICTAMAEQGAEVVLSDVDAARCEQGAQALRETGAVAHAMPCDLSRREAVETLVDALIARCGPLDVLVCNAGIQGPAGPLADVSDADWDTVFGVNLRSVAWLTARAIPAMAERGGGSVILMSSIAGLRGNRSIGLYGLTKAALAQMARNLAVEWGPRGVRVNAISPGLIRTPLATPLLENAAFMQRRLSLTPLRRVGEPFEVAGVAVLLASAAGGFISGHNLIVDGGTTISDGN